MDMFKKTEILSASIASSVSNESRSGTETSEDQENGEPLTAATTIDSEDSAENVDEAGMITATSPSGSGDVESRIEIPPTSMDLGLVEPREEASTGEAKTQGIETEFPSSPSMPPEPTKELKIPDISQAILDGDINADSLSDLEEGSNYDSDDSNTLDARTRKAPRQISQIVQYTRLMEERVQALEKEVKILKAKKGRESAKETTQTPEKTLQVDSDVVISPSTAPVAADSSSSDVADTESVPMFVPEVKRASWAAYAAKSTHAIEVFYGYQDEIPSPEPHIQTLKKTDSDNHENLHLLANNVADPIPGRGERPTLIRISSFLIRQELSKITGFEFKWETQEVLAPFKPIFAFEAEIRRHLAKLEERLDELKKKEADLLLEFHSDNEILPADASTDTSSVGKAAAKDGHATTIKPVQRPIFPRHPDPTPQKDPIKNKSGYRVNPQTIGILMIATNADCDTAETYLKTNASYNEAYEDYASDHDFNSYPDLKAERNRRREVFEAYTIVEEWQAIINLLDSDLAETFRIRAQIERKELKSIAFEDLCHLFEPEQMVLEQEGKDLQVLRVFSSTGGRRIFDDGLLGNVAAQSQEDAPVKGAENIGSLFHVVSKFSPFLVDCYYIDFDGYHFGPVQKTITINKYNGEVPLTALPLSPAWFNTKSSVTPKDPETTETTIAVENPEKNGAKDLETQQSQSPDPWVALLARGKKFVKLCDAKKVVHRQYCGLSFDDPPEEVDSKVIIDFKMASLVTTEDRSRGIGWVPKVGLRGPSKVNERELVGPGFTKRNTCSVPDCNECVPVKVVSPILDDQTKSQQQTRDFILKYPLLQERLNQTEHDLEDSDYQLMQSRVFGFILRSRKWARLNVDNIEKINHGENNFKKLVLPDGYANIVQALVETHTKTSKPATRAKNSETHQVDLVRGKGKGLIILLHGAPGVGKTSTAECVADHTRRPLFPITCGDIGDNAKDVEKNLEWCFQLAHKWGCVLLLDEADVFLAERSKTDLKRNALVSVFLRVLEYYAGILFLTTNRVGTFDEAFKSRIHMSLGYPPLDQEQTKRIWKMNLKRTKQAKDLDLDIDSERILDFSIAHWERAQETNGGAAWNGRQIRNAFQTAIALAKWDFEQKKDEKPLKAVLNDRHFEKVAKASRQFDNYLTKVYGGSTEADRALEDQKRMDGFEIGKPKTYSSVTPSAKFGSSKPKSQRKSAERNAELDMTPVKKKKRVVVKEETDSEDEIQVEGKAMDQQVLSDYSA